VRAFSLKLMSLTLNLYLEVWENLCIMFTCLRVLGSMRLSILLTGDGRRVERKGFGGNYVLNYRRIGILV